MSIEATLASVGGENRCGGEAPYFRGIIAGVGVCYEIEKGSGLKCRLAGGGFVRGDKAENVLRGD